MVLYRITHGGQGMELIHRTALDEVPYAIQPFQNKVGLLTGVPIPEENFYGVLIKINK